MSRNRSLFLCEAAETTALGFINGLEQAHSHISRHPATGFSRYAHALNLPGQRAWPLARYPHLVFYPSRRATSTCGACCTTSGIPAWMQGGASRYRSVTGRYFALLFRVLVPPLVHALFGRMSLL